jgi:hypothetical protein
MVAELLAELAAERMLRVDIECRIDRYLAIPDAVLDLLDTRNSPPVPLHEVGRRGDRP